MATLQAWGIDCDVAPGELTEEALMQAPAEDRRSNHDQHNFCFVSATCAVASSRLCSFPVSCFLFVVFVETYPKLSLSCVTCEVDGTPCVLA